MIRAMLFDLDGTLVQTEHLKALSYARAVQELCPQHVSEADVLSAYQDVVGLSRREVAMELVARFKLVEKAAARIPEFGVSAPWQAFVQIRLSYYVEMLADPQVLLDNLWPHNLALLEQARRSGCKLGLATMSYCKQTGRVLKILGLSDAFDFIASRDDVERGKPDPQIYHLVADELNVPPGECLVIEDSPAGVKAAIAAGMWCIAVSTPYTHRGLHKLDIIEKRWIVDAPASLAGVVAEMIEARKLELFV